MSFKSKYEGVQKLMPSINGWPFLCPLFTGDFAGATALLLLSLGGNQIVSVAEEAFHHLRALQVTPDNFNPRNDDGTEFVFSFGMGVNMFVIVAIKTLILKALVQHPHHPSLLSLSLSVSLSRALSLHPHLLCLARSLLSASFVCTCVAVFSHANV